MSSGLPEPKRWQTVASCLAICALGLLHWIVPLTNIHFHNLIQHLYFLPLMVLALTQGWRGALIAAGLTAVVEIPHTVEAWTVNRLYAMDQILEFPVFCAAGLTVGLMVEKDRRQKLSLERTTRELSVVYEELRDKVDQLKRAERLSAAGQLSAGLAHEIRNPLASLSGAAGILQRGHTDPESQNECIEIIQTESARLNRLLGSFLEFARPRLPRFQTVAVADLFQSVIALSSHAAAAKAIRLAILTGTAPTALEGDPEQLKQVLLNLVLNAIQAAPRESTVTLEGQARHEFVELLVRDQGPGVDPAQLNQIFDPFFTTKTDGTGLGLAIASQIAAQHGGEIRAENAASRGMVFRVILPVAQPVAREVRA